MRVPCTPSSRSMTSVDSEDLTKSSWTTVNLRLPDSIKSLFFQNNYANRLDYESILIDMEISYNFL